MAIIKHAKLQVVRGEFVFCKNCEMMKIETPMSNSHCLATAEYYISPLTGKSEVANINLVKLCSTKNRDLNCLDHKKIKGIFKRIVRFFKLHGA